MRLSHVVMEVSDRSGISVVVAECGATTLMLDDGSLVDADYDFYSPPWEHRATCEQCWKTHLAKCAKQLRRLSA